MKAKDIDKIIYLDCALTGKSYKTAVHTFKQFRGIEEFCMGELYYLSDGGYSRIYCREADSGEIRLFLASESREEVKDAWARCKELISDIEVMCNNYIKDEVIK